MELQHFQVHIQIVKLYSRTLPNCTLNCKNIPLNTHFSFFPRKKEYKNSEFWYKN